MFGKLGDMMKKLQEMKQMSEEVKTMLENMNIDYASSDGNFKCSMNGNRILKSLHIHPSLLQMGKDDFEKKLLIYLNEAYLKAQTETEAEMKKMAKDMLPGFLD
ncbi:MAG: YbaB/EbfC family nucleoid-associated protein [Bacteroidia bacterium]|nr:YbaB/EbfC family nucleoid-associated protein [Bacteroidia bacterium]